MLMARRRRIWIIDDNPDYCNVVKRISADKRPDWELEFFPDSRKLLDLLEKDVAMVPDLIVLDLIMPEPDGIKMLHYIKRNRQLRPIPTIIVSESDSDTDASLCYQAGANSYIVKPASLEELRHFVAVTWQYWLDIAATPSHQRL
ncbi:response regulator receiver domain-containing protein [Larkinella arboricola]|uniref:Response regulator receiver domain-containing protein n=2 Tax=Larkinella arboricola TaxID=643671 RepID=A0A327WP97_LARAB|nr:response regulator receiver domain-containing protein [Larkinella arboricola]